MGSFSVPSVSACALVSNQYFNVRQRPVRFLPYGALCVVLALISCRNQTLPTPGFEAITLPFQHASGAAGQYLLPEIMGSGVALLDFDGDGDLDVFLVQQHSPAGSHKLFRNDHGTFTDVTAASGLDVVHSEPGYYGMGVATADFDNDGRPDLLVTALGGNRLYRNLGGGHFEDVTSQSPALAMPNRWSTSAAFFDYDNDGWQDLVILSYVDYLVTANKHCQAPTGATDYCTPRVYRSVPSHLFHNQAGHFTDVTTKSGLDQAAGPGLGVVAFDANLDGFQDLFVANDSSANHLWINQGNGTFHEEALQRGVAYAENGLARAGMGVALGDYDNDGAEDLIVLNLIREGATLFRNNGTGDFTDVSVRTAIHALTFQFTGFGVGWLDADLDGRLDLFLANGAVTMNGGQRGNLLPYQERNLLLLQQAGHFANVPISALDRPGVYRGAAFGDIDNDGDLDIVVSANNGQALLLRNHSSPKSWLSVAAPAGSRLELRAEGLPLQVRYARTASSYLSASDSRVLFVVRGKIESLRAQLPGRAPITIPPTQIVLNKVLTLK